MDDAKLAQIRADLDAHQQANQRAVQVARCGDYLLMFNVADADGFFSPTLYDVPADRLLAFAEPLRLP